ncbi:hypothetical protein T11_10541 [Trichinella zimbabwensis]|uniref:Uncharacterized protein n=1 Tax=Trichinella zimbabwensis TaxID=268475 RepID=A0A0V1HTU0_9BILA|nr:hypothetical protein T11_10541 [Trichinella zimbabwensis]
MLCGIVDDDPVAVETLLGWMICVLPPISPRRFAVSSTCSSVDAKSCQLLWMFLLLESFGKRPASVNIQPLPVAEGI